MRYVRDILNNNGECMSSNEIEQTYHPMMLTVFFKSLPNSKWSNIPLES